MRGLLKYIKMCLEKKTAIERSFLEQKHDCYIVDKVMKTIEWLTPYLIQPGHLQSSLNERDAEKQVPVEKKYKTITIATERIFKTKI